MSAITVDLMTPSVITVETPDESLTVVLSAGAQGPPGSYELKVFEVDASGVVVLDYTNGAWQVLTLVGTVTALSVVNWPNAGKGARLVLEIANTGNFGIAAWPANTRWIGGPPTISVGAGAEDLIVLSTGTSGAKIFASVVGQNFTL